MENISDMQLVVLVFYALFISWFVKGNIITYKLFQVLFEIFNKHVFSDDVAHCLYRAESPLHAKFTLLTLYGALPFKYGILTKKICKLSV